MLKCCGLYRNCRGYTSSFIFKKQYNQYGCHLDQPRQSPRSSTVVSCVSSSPCSYWPRSVWDQHRLPCSHSNGRPGPSCTPEALAPRQRQSIPCLTRGGRGIMGEILLGSVQWLWLANMQIANFPHYVWYGIRDKSLHRSVQSCLLNT